MARKFLILVLLMSVSFSGLSAVRADGLGRPWKDHAVPYDFMFENLIDTHQQMKLRNNGTLHGFIYIRIVDEEIEGAPAGVSVARRADCSIDECLVGWEVIGIPVSGAKLVQRGPRLWEFDPASLPADPEYVHFHWTALDGSPNPKKPCGLKTIDEDGAISYNGYLFKRIAVTTFYWLGGNEDKEKGRLVEPGVDLHSNIYGIWSGGDGGEGEDHEEGSCGGHETGGDTGEGGHDSGGHETGG